MKASALESLFNSLFNKVSGLKEICEIFKNTFLQNTPGDFLWILRNMQICGGASNYPLFYFWLSHFD